MRNPIVIDIQAVPLLEQIEKRDRKAEPHLEIRPDALAQMFQFTNLRQQRKDGFDQHSVVPLAAPADFQVLRLIDRTSKAGVRQNDHFLAHLFDERQKRLVGNVRRFHRPVGNESELVRQQAELAADNPFPGSKTFLADAFSLGLMVFANRMTQLDPVRIDHAKDRRLSQKLFRQSAMRLQAAKEPGALGQSWKQLFAVLTDPSIKSVLRAAFQSKQQSESDKFTQGKFGLNMFRLLCQHIVYTAKKFYDKVFLSHGSVSFLYGLVTNTVETFP